MRVFISALLLCVIGIAASAGDGNRLTYLNDMHPYYPHTHFPKLITPQWVGEDDVEAVVILAIDDMRETEKYEAYLRPILQRLKQIDGRAPVSIMTCKVDPADDQLQSWLGEGLSIEVHTRDHPCPLLQKGNFAAAKETYEACIDQMASIPNNVPVAYRMPCCDSLNTVSPRFYTEIFNKRTPEGRFLQIDTSVFNVFTADDPEIPKELLTDPNGKAKFEKYVPYDRSFVNTIENYPYPYVIENQCWQFPCLAPSDWSAQHYHGVKNDERTVRDMKAALDITVIKKGVLNLVFHPHGWIRSDQVVELIDHAVEKHGKKVKFLTFREALDRINRNLLAGHSLRNAKVRDSLIRILDINRDGYMDVYIPNAEGKLMYQIWEPEKGVWQMFKPQGLAQESRISRAQLFSNLQFGILTKAGDAISYAAAAFHFRDRRIDRESNDLAFGRSVHYDPFIANAQEQMKIVKLYFLVENSFTNRDGDSRAVCFRDLDGDGMCEFLSATPETHGLFRWSEKDESWEELPFTLPENISWLTSDGKDAGLRFVDFNADGHDDIVFSDHAQYGVWLWKDMQTGWSIEAIKGKRGDKPPAEEIPMIVREDGTNNGVWFHSKHLWVQNEDTADMPNLVDRRTYEWLLKNVSDSKPSP